MKRFFSTTGVATVGAVLILAAQGWADGRGNHPSGNSGHHGSMGGRRGEPGHSYRANERFDYGKHGFGAESWTHYRWSNYYRCFCFWAPKYGWCFYEPSYSCYLPISYYAEVYPQFAPPVTTPVSPSPSVVQQTTVVAAPAGPVGDLPIPPPGLAPLPAPTAIQKTKVGPGGP
jgi:hypothetical protein